MKYVHKTTGTCSTHIEIETDGDIIKEVFFWGGCNGNLQGVSRLIAGMPVADALKKLEGIRCGKRSTSCPDQLCKGLHDMGYIVDDNQDNDNGE